MSYSSRALRVCALLALPTSAFAQSTKGPTIFSPSSQVGTVNLRAAVVLPDYTVRPLPLLKVVALRNDRPDSLASETDLEGRTSMTLKVGMYTVRARTPQPIGGRTYEWSLRIVVRPQQSQSLQLTNSNASRADSVATTPTVVAEAKPTPQPAPPTQSAAPQPTTPQPVAPQTTTPKMVASQSATPPSVTPPSATTPKTSPASKSTTPPKSTTAPKSSAPSKPVAPTTTPEKVVAKAEPPKAEPPKPAPTPVPAPATHSAPVTTAQAKPPVPVSSSAAAPKRIDATPRPRPRTHTSGLMLGLSFDASSIRSDDLNNSNETGPGAAGMVGWGITKNIALAIDMSGAQISSVNGNYGLGHADIGARWHFVNRTAFVPFVDVGYGGRAIMKRNVTLTDDLGNTSTGTLTYMGGGVSFGGGLDYFVTPGVAFGGAFKWTTGRFSQVRFENLTVDGLQLDATSARFNMGFTWYPMGKR